MPAMHAVPSPAPSGRPQRRRSGTACRCRAGTGRGGPARHGRRTMPAPYLSHAKAVCVCCAAACDRSPCPAGDKISVTGTRCAALPAASSHRRPEFARFVSRLLGLSAPSIPSACPLAASPPPCPGPTPASPSRQPSSRDARARSRPRSRATASPSKTPGAAKGAQ